MIDSTEAEKLAFKFLTSEWNVPLKDRDWFTVISSRTLGEDGICCLCKSVREWDLLAEEYRLYRFLTIRENVSLTMNSLRPLEIQKPTAI